MDHPAERLDILYAEIERTSREIAVLQAEQVHLLAEYNALFAASPFCDFVTDEVALALRSTLNMANRRLTLATTLTTRLPNTLAALETGDLDLARAEAIAEATRPLSDELAGEVEDRVLAAALQQNPNQVRRAATKAVLQLDPDGAEERHVRRRADRYVEIVPAAEGMADLYALLPGEDAMRIKVRLDAYAKAQPKADKRTTDQRRADAMTDLLLDRSVGPITTAVHLTAPATLLAAATQTALTASHRADRPAGKPRSTRHRHAAMPIPAALGPGTADSATPDPDTLVPAPTAPAPTVPVPATSIPAALNPAAPAAGTAGPATPPPAIPDTATPGTAAPAPTVSTTTTPAAPAPAATAAPATSAPTTAAPAPAASAPATAAPAGPADVPTASSHPAAGGGAYPAELAGYGVITGSQAIALAARDATWRRLLTDPATGELTDLSRHQYSPPAALADHVRARDRQCVFPGCAVPAARCDLDHRVPYPRGETSVENLAALCRHHHRLKHRGGWTLRRRADGAHVWTSPQEREYLNPTIPLTPPPEPPPTPEPPPAPCPVVVVDDPPPF